MQRQRLRVATTRRAWTCNCPAPAVPKGGPQRPLFRLSLLRDQCCAALARSTPDGSIKGPHRREIHVEPSEPPDDETTRRGVEDLQGSARLRRWCVRGLGRPPLRSTRENPPWSHRSRGQRCLRSLSWPLQLRHRRAAFPLRQDGRPPRLVDHSGGSASAPMAKRPLQPLGLG